MCEMIPEHKDRQKQRIKRRGPNKKKLKHINTISKNIQHLIQVRQFPPKQYGKFQYISVCISCDEQV